MRKIAAKKIERQAIPTIIADELRIAITRGQFKPGEALRQELLAADFSASRIPVREALRQLEAEGLVIISPNKGACVVSHSAAELLEIFEIRALLEPAALDAAFPNLNEDLLDQAKKLLDDLERKSSETAWGDLNWRFHLLLYNAAKKPKLISMIDSLRISSEHYLVNLDKPSDYKSQAMKEHRLILEYCVQKKRKEAREHLRHHIEESASHLQKALAG